MKSTYNALVKKKVKKADTTNITFQSLYVLNQSSYNCCVHFGARLNFVPSLKHWRCLPQMQQQRVMLATELQFFSIFPRRQMSPGQTGIVSSKALEKVDLELARSACGGSLSTVTSAHTQRAIQTTSRTTWGLTVERGPSSAWSVRLHSQRWQAVGATCEVNIYRWG